VTPAGGGRTQRRWACHLETVRSRRERVLRHGTGAMLVVGAAPWALLGAIALFVISDV
jgi:hypothetical protein